MIEKFVFITASFLKEHSIELTWTQMLWGLNQSLLSPKEISIYALQIIEEEDINDSNIILLAGVSKNEFFQVRELIEKLSALEKNESENVTQQKWLYVILLWLYENREHVDKPLEKIEIVYADFNYPISISSFVSYMPAENSASDLTGDAYLYKQWKEFLSYPPNSSDST